MNEAAEQALRKAADILGEHFLEFVIVCAQKQSRDPILEHSGSIFAAHGLAEAAAYKLDVQNIPDKEEGDDDSDNEGWKKGCDGDDFTDGDPKVKA
jgi:DNA-directed RNA polymerase alpha subunit